jgi:hypothetical protein
LSTSSKPDLHKVANLPIVRKVGKTLEDITSTYSPHFN